jgi:acetoin utilization protein AcuB
MDQEARLRAWHRGGAPRTRGMVPGGPANEPVEAFLSRPVVTVRADAPLREARELMASHGIHHLLVEDRGRLVGIISDRDVARATSPYADRAASSTRDEATLDQPVYHVATFRLHVIDRHAPIEEAAAIFVERSISALPVIDERGDICGIVTTRDALRGLLTCIVPVRKSGAA